MTTKEPINHARSRPTPLHIESLAAEKEEYRKLAEKRGEQLSAVEFLLHQGFEIWHQGKEGKFVYTRDANREYDQTGFDPLEIIAEDGLTDDFEITPPLADPVMLASGNRMLVEKVTRLTEIIAEALGSVMRAREYDPQDHAVVKRMLDAAKVTLEKVAEC